jgi:hypothetical protein
VAKQVAISPRPREPSAALDSFVHGNGAQRRKNAPTAAESADGQRMKRLTFDIPAGLHLRMKLGCVREGRDMADALRELIAERWP